MRLFAGARQTGGEHPGLSVACARRDVWSGVVGAVFDWRGKAYKMLFLNGDSAKRQCPFGFRVRHFEVADAGVANSRFMAVPVLAYSSWTGVTR